MSDSLGVLRRLLQRQAGLAQAAAQVDEAVAEYIAQALEDADPADLAGLVDLLLSFVPEAEAALSPEQQLQLLADLKQQLQHQQEEAVEESKQQVEGEEEDRCGEVCEEEQRSEDGTERLSSSDENDPLLEGVQFLLSLVPEMEEPTVRYVLTTVSANNRAHAAQYLVENSSPEGIERLKQAQEKFEEQQRIKEREEEERSRALKKNTLDRYADVDVEEANKTHKPVLRLTSTKQKIRFRDGKVVSTKGEKVIIEQAPEYDGGSRGRVKTKGKRGVGWR